MKKIAVIILLALLFSFCAYLLKKTPKEKVYAENEDTMVVVEPKIPEIVYTFKKDEISEDCSLDSTMFCALEKAVKCTINPDLESCKNAKIPQFIFMKDAGVDRPTEISYKITDKKILNNQNVELYTDSTCNGTWFGLCHGRVIYVLAPDGKDEWIVKDIYAIEQ